MNPFNNPRPATCIPHYSGLLSKLFIPPPFNIHGTEILSILQKECGFRTSNKLGSVHHPVMLGDITGSSLSYLGHYRKTLPDMQNAGEDVAGTQI